MIEDEDHAAIVADLRSELELAGTRIHTLDVELRDLRTQLVRVLTIAEQLHATDERAFLQEYPELRSNIELARSSCGPCSAFRMARALLTELTA